MTVDQIAEACHEMNRLYCQSIGDWSQPSWKDAPDWQKRSAVQGVQYLLATGASPREMHLNWFQEKAKDGWEWGPVKNPDRRTHPCMIDYDLLPLDQRKKDDIFHSTVMMLK